MATAKGGKKKPDPDAWRKGADAPDWAKNMNRDEQGYYILPDKVAPPKLTGKTYNNPPPVDPGPNATSDQMVAYDIARANYQPTTSVGVADPAEKAKYDAYAARVDKYKGLNTAWKLKLQTDTETAQRKALYDANMANAAKQSDLLKPPPPPPTMSNAEVQRSADQIRLDAMRRRGFRSTQLAGDTGGYASSATGKTSLLG